MSLDVIVVAPVRRGASRSPTPELDMAVHRPWASVMGLFGRPCSSCTPTPLLIGTRGSARRCSGRYLGIAQPVLRRRRRPLPVGVHVSCSTVMGWQGAYYVNAVLRAAASSSFSLTVFCADPAKSGLHALRRRGRRDAASRKPALSPACRLKFALPTLCTFVLLHRRRASAARPSRAASTPTSRRTAVEVLGARRGSSFSADAHDRCCRSATSSPRSSGGYPGATSSVRKTGSPSSCYAITDRHVPVLGVSVAR